MDKILISILCVSVSILQLQVHNVNAFNSQSFKTMRNKNKNIINMASTSIPQAQQQIKNPFSFIINLKNKIFPSKNKPFQERSKEDLADGIAKFYDESSGIWLDVWGEHMHHGFYEPTELKLHDVNHQQAQIDMIDKAIDWSYDDICCSFGGQHGSSLNKVQPKSVVDVGCGVGGSSRHIVNKFNMQKGDGVSLSPYQIMRAKKFTSEANLTSKVHYQVADALNMPFANNTYDLTWSMESGEHMPDKEKFMSELVRVTAPSGRIIVVTWCHRELKKDEKSLKPWEVDILQKISDAYYLPKWCPVSTYIQLAKAYGLEDVRSADWSEYVKPFWLAVFMSALRPRNFIRMLKSGMTVIKGALATFHMMRGFRKGVVKFVIMTGRKEKIYEELPVEHWGTEE